VPCGTTHSGPPQQPPEQSGQLGSVFILWSKYSSRASTDSASGSVSCTKAVHRTRSSSNLSEGQCATGGAHATSK